MSRRKREKNPHAVELGRKGGMSTAKKGSDFYRIIGRLRTNPGDKRRPDDQVTQRALDERVNYVLRKQRRLEAEAKAGNENSS